MIVHGLLFCVFCGIAVIYQILLLPVSTIFTLCRLPSSLYANATVLRVNADDRRCSLVKKGNKLTLSVRLNVLHVVQ